MNIIKELFIENKYKPEELSKLIDKYLIPQEPGRSFAPFQL
jgi:hypothetical protein